MVSELGTCYKHKGRGYGVCVCSCCGVYGMFGGGSVGFGCESGGGGAGLRDGVVCVVICGGYGVYGCMSYIYAVSVVYMTYYSTLRRNFRMLIKCVILV